MVDAVTDLQREALAESLKALLAIQRYLERSGESYLLDTFGVHDAIAAIQKATGDE